MYSCIFSNYDTWRQHVRQAIPCDVFLFSDTKQTSDDDTRHVLVDGSFSFVTDFEKSDDFHAAPPTIKAKYFKCFPFALKELQGYDSLVYLDGNVQMISDTFLTYLVKSGVMNHALTVSRHPDRACLYKEGEYCQRVDKYRETMDLGAQMAHYKERGCPPDAGLFCSGILFMNCARGVELQGLLGEWFAEIMRFHLRNTTRQPYPQCQMCLAYVLWSTKCTFFQSIPTFYYMYTYLNIGNKGVPNHNK